jgi:hypothetical protein
VRWAVRRGVVRRGALRLEELGAGRREQDLRKIGSAFIKTEGSALGEVGMTTDTGEEGVVVAGEAERGALKMETGEVRIRAREGRTKSGVRGVGVPCIWA